MTLSKKGLLAVGAAATPFVLFYTFDIFDGTHIILCASLLGFWVSAAAADIIYTLVHHAYIAAYEQNPFLRVLTVKLSSSRPYGLAAAVCTMLAAEAVLVVVLAPFIVICEWDFGFVALVSSVSAGMAHVAGLAQSMAFVRIKHNKA